MFELEGLLGQDAISERLVESLREPDARAVRLTGPSGSGKSYIARLVAEKWCETDGRCVVAIGDDDHSWREFYPLSSGLQQAPSDWTGLASAGGRSAVRIADSTVGGGVGVGTSIFDLLAATFRQSTERALKPYSDLARGIILDLKRLGRSRPVLLIAENAHWWDADSLSLLGDVLSEPLRAAIPQLNSVVALMVDTEEEQVVVAPKSFKSLQERYVAQTIHAASCTREQFPAVLASFGLKEVLPEEVADSLFAATHGHLKLAEQIAAYAEDNSIETLLSPAGKTYLSTLVSARFASLGTARPEVMALLAGAAVLGLSFTEKDLLCIAGEHTKDMKTSIEEAEGIGFIEREKNRISFSHDVIRSAILDDQTKSQRRLLHAKLAECLAILRPGDYEARAQALSEAAEPQDARDMTALACVARLRRGVPSPQVLARVTNQFPDDHELRRYLEVIAAGYDSVDAGDFSKPLPALRTASSSETPVMAAERNYLAALCLMELETPAAVTEAQMILSSWIPNLREEAELSLRFLCLLQQAQIHSEMFDDARATEKKIERQLFARSRYDLDAAVMLQVQNRRAGAVDIPEFAQKRIAEAVGYFERGTGDTSRDRLELFRSLTNLAGIQIRLGRDSEAYAKAQEAERIALESPDISHRLDVLASNLVLAGYRSGAMDLGEAISRQEQIVESPEGSHDDFLQRCNLVAYLMLDQQDSKADSELERLGRELQSSEREESFLIYHWHALWTASAVLKENTDKARERHAKMDELTASLKWPGAPYVRRRQRLLDDVLDTLDLPGDRREVDGVILQDDQMEIGPAWSYYGRLIPCCELSFWSDS